MRVRLGVVVVVWVVHAVLARVVAGFDPVASGMELRPEILWVPLLYGVRGVLFLIVPGWIAAFGLAWITTGRRTGGVRETNG